MTNFNVRLFETIGIPLQNFRKESEKTLGFNPLGIFPLVAFGVVIYLLIKK